MKYLIVFVLLTVQLFAQKGVEIEYEEISIPKIFDQNGKEEKLSTELLEAFSVPKLYVLQIKDHVSVFTKIEKINNSQNGSSVQFFGVLPYNSLIDFNQNQFKQEWLIETKKYIVVDSVSINKEYQLTREKSTYLGFNVKQAVIKEGDYTTYIWYASDLPNRFGPRDFINLPGLVLKVESFLNDDPVPRYSLKAKSIHEKDKMILHQLFKAKEISKKDFEKLKAKYDKKMLNEHQGVDKD